MREILFRGKTKQGEWIEGFLFNSQLCRIFWATAFKKEEDNIFYCEGKDVIPETIGQFTGLTDKNGNKIFEGDIIKFSHPAYEETTIGFVGWEENEVGFVLRTKNDYDIIGYSSEFYEVIGNIYDNPELLGE